MSDQPPNPYITPQSETDTSEEEYAELGYFTTTGRLGRLRYIAYGIGANLVGGGIQAGAAALAMVFGEQTGAILGGIASIVVAIAILVLYIFWTIRRINDFNMSGWLTFIFVIPIINFALWFIPGTHGSNRFGLMPPRNGVGVILLALLLPVLIIGILAAIAIPAYQDYITRAKVQEGTSLSDPVHTALGVASTEGDFPTQSTDLPGHTRATDQGFNHAGVKSSAARDLQDGHGHGDHYRQAA